MNIATSERKNAVPASLRSKDRRMFAIILAWLWFGVVGGFGFDIVRKLSTGAGLHYPLIVHVHAVVFVGWMALFTCQLLLIRVGKPATHKRLGFALAGFVVLMVIVGTMTTYQVDQIRLQHPGNGDPAFFVIAEGTLVVFAVLVGAGLSMRKSPDVHKRLMLLAAIYVTDAGFGRFGPSLFIPLVDSAFWRAFLIPFFFTDLAMIALGVHDWVTRRRLYGAYVIAMLFIGCAELLLTWMYADSPTVRAVVLHLLS